MFILFLFLYAIGFFNFLFNPTHVFTQHLCYGHYVSQGQFLGRVKLVVLCSKCKQTRPLQTLKNAKSSYDQKWWNHPLPWPAVPAKKEKKFIFLQH